MSIITIASSDLITNSRAVINANFAELDSLKAVKSANLSDLASAQTARNNILPSQATFGGKVLGTDGSNVSWVDPSGANKATNVVIGLTKLSCAAVDAAVPIAVGDNDGRLPTANEKAALAGTGTPSGANKYATADTIAGFEAVSNKSTTTTLGTSDTLYPSQKAVKTYVDTQTTNVYLGNQALADGANTITAGYQTAWRYAIIYLQGTTSASNWKAEVFIYKSGKTSGTFTFVLVTTETGGLASVSGTTITLAKIGSTSAISATAYYYQ